MLCVSIAHAIHKKQLKKKLLTNFLARSFFFTCLYIFSIILIQPDSLHNYPGITGIPPVQYSDDFPCGFL